MPEPPIHPAPATPRPPVPHPTTGPPEAANDDGGWDRVSAMSPRFNLLFRFFARRFFGHFDLDDATVASLRALQDRGSVIFVMRYASRLDYFLFNELFRREGLELSRFANGIRYLAFRPLWAYVRAVFARRPEPPEDPDRAPALDTVARLTANGRTFFLFLRTARLGGLLRGRRGAVEQGKNELNLLEEVVRTAWDGGTEVHLVPLALFWKKGPRIRSRFLNLTYGATTRPSDLAKVASFLITYRGLHVIARKVRRSILTFLYREEKVVEGPTLRPRHKVQEVVTGTPEVEAAIVAEAERRNISVDRARAEAGKIFREIAANMNSTFLALLNVIVTGIMRRLFASIELVGIEKIAEYAKRHPLVLAPSHRSYFDFLIISSAFYGNHLVPPHIAARENMAFGPMGFIFRRAGAFFLRRSFDDPLYKEVFRAYVSYLIREGFTQEFFIEGGRSRTGKSMPPKLGLLTWDVDAFLSSARRDLFFVPSAITYERLVEEGAMVDELEGAAKTEESMLRLVKARKFLQRRFGTVHVSFGEPISLAGALGDRRERFASRDSPDVTAEERDFVRNLGNRIVERINWAVIPNATAIAASAMLGVRARGLFRPELALRIQQIVDLLQLQGVRVTPALRHDSGDFNESIASLLRADLLKSANDPRGEILYYEPSARRALDIYRNAIVHYLATPSFLAGCLLAGPTRADLRAEITEWLEIFYAEFFVPRGEVLAAHFDAFLDHFERMAWIERRDGQLRATEKGAAHLAFLAEQTRGVVEVYYATCASVAALAEPIGRKALLKAVGAQFERADLLGEVDRPESVNDTTIGNAVALLLDRGILAIAGESGKKNGVNYTPGPAFGELVPLRERLAAALSAR